MDFLYDVDVGNKQISRNYLGHCYTRRIRSPRDTIKYRVLAARSLLAVCENRGFDIFHFVPRDQHQALITYRAEIGSQKYTDTGFFKSYFATLIARLLPYYPQLETCREHLRSAETYVRLYSLFDLFFRKTLLRDPIYLGMAISLELRIHQDVGRTLPLECIRAVYGSSAFSVEDFRYAGNDTPIVAPSSVTEGVLESIESRLSRLEQILHTICGIEKDSTNK